MSDDPSHRHGYDRDSLLDWRKALPGRPGPERCPDFYQLDGIVGTQCILPDGHEGSHAYTLSGDA